MNHQSFAGLLVASVVFAASCGAVAVNDPTPLAGRTFLSTSVQGRALVPGTVVRISFDQSRLSMAAGCNSMGGTFSVDAGRLRVADLAMTEMGCEPQLMAQDEWLARLLADGTKVSLDGTTLVLEGPDVRLTMTDRKVVDPDRPLLGTRWVLDAIVAGDAVSSIPAGAAAAITIREGQMDVEAGCNRGGGSVDVTAGTLTVGPIALTKMGCAPDVMAVEAAVTSVLAGDVSYRIDGDLLILSSGNTGLMFRAAG